MGEIQRDALDAEALEARVELPMDAAPSEAVVIALVHGVERLRRDHDAIADSRVLRLQPLADEALAAAASVGIGRVEAGDAAIPGGIHEPKGVVLRCSLPEEGR